MATRLVDGVWLLDLGLRPPLRSNAYLLDERKMGVDGSDLTLCDTGLRWNRPSILAELADAGYDPGDLDRVLLTHYDLDHVGGLRALRPAFDGPVYIGSADRELANGDGSLPLVHHKGLFHRAARRLFPLPVGMDVRSVTDRQRIGQFTAHVTPGHNPGHVVYVHDAGIALLGDLVWEDDGALTTPIRFDSYDLATIAESVRTFADRVGPFEVAAMGHGMPLTTGGDEALQDLAADL